MSIKHPRPRICLVALVFALAVLNSLAPWGRDAADRGQAILELCTGLGAVVCALVVAWRVTGSSRWWRLFCAAAVTSWLFGQTLWWTRSAGVDEEVATAAGVAAYVFALAFVLAAVIVLVLSSGGPVGQHEGPLGRPQVTNILDGVVASLAFLILAAMGEFGQDSVASLPRSGNPTLEVGFALAQVLLVGAAVTIAMVYNPDRPYRANYLLLVAGIALTAASDRMVDYFRFVGAEGGELWGGIGFIVGPLIIAFAMLETSHGQAEIDRADRAVDWAQLIVPYIGFLGVAVLFAFHTLIGQPLNPFAVCTTVLMVLLVTIRQVAATRAQRRLTRRLYWAVRHDPLTGLPNRILFAHLLDAAARGGRFALIFIDLDDFKEVNDRYGHAAGDEVLCAVGERLQRCVSDDDTVARVGGDEFAILIDGGADQLEVVADRVRVAIRDPFPVQSSSVRIRASMGLVGPGADGLPQTSDDLLRQADIAMFDGKQFGKDTAVVYQASSGVRADFAIALRNAKGDAPPGFSLVYQPIVQLPHGTPVAVEVLARWTAPNGLRIAPETFVEAAEAAGLGAVLDGLVLDLACREVGSAGLSLDVHVNLGAARLGNTEFEEHIRRTVDRHRIEPNRLVIEITETVPIVDIAEAAAQIVRLNAMGVNVALDDFGAGYNSLTYLHSLPVQIVKLDRGLAVGAEPTRDLAVYRSVVGLCADLGFTVIAEGIESPAQAETIMAAGCRFAQGHLYGRPAPIRDLARGLGSQL